jgi:hypothetical protein
MMSFSLSGGVEVYGFIAPTEITDEYPVIDPLYGIDGFRNVNTLSDLNFIPNLRRRAGMVVGIGGGTTYYKLNPGPWNGTISDWSLFQTGSGGTFTGGTVTGSTIFTNGLTANTLNVNGVNITGDTYTTGGTYYTGGTIIFDYNTVGNFQVTGLTEDLNNAIASLAETDELTIELDVLTNKIRLKDIVAPGSGGTRTFQGDTVIESGLTATTAFVTSTQWTLDFMDSLNIQIYAPNELSINSKVDLVNTPTIIILVNNLPYTYATPINIGELISVTSDVNSVIQFNITNYL